MKFFNSEFSYIEVWFNNQYSEALQILKKINITLVINESVKYQKMTRYSIQPRGQTFVKCYGLLSLAKTMGKRIVKNASKSLTRKYSKNILIMLNYLQKMPLKLLQKKAIQKRAKATGDLIGNKLLIELQKFKKV